jgi:hypothetical protein
MQLYGQMKEWGMPKTFEEAVEWVDASESQTTGFAFIGNLNISKHIDLFLTELNFVILQEMPQTFSSYIRHGVASEFWRKNSARNLMHWPYRKIPISKAFLIMRKCVPMCHPKMSSSYPKTTCYNGKKNLYL